MRAVPKATDLELLDAGEGRRLERFGPKVVDRPAPTALAWLGDRSAWSDADLRFDPDEGWSGGRPGRQHHRTPAPWPVDVAGLTMEVRPTASGGLGLYPEHVANLAWLEAQIARADRRARYARRRRSAADRPEPVRAHRPRDPGGIPGGRRGRPRRRRPLGDRLGRPERRAVRSRRPAHPLARRRCVGVRRARGASGAPVRRDRPGPTVVRAREAPPLAPRGRAARAAHGLRPDPRE